MVRKPERERVDNTKPALSFRRYPASHRLAHNKLIPSTAVDCGEGPRDSRKLGEFACVKLLANVRAPHKPRRLTPYNLQQPIFTNL